MRLKRLPIIRHVRYFMAIRAINKHYDFWAQNCGMLPINAQSDYDHACKIWLGEA